MDNACCYHVIIVIIETHLLSYGVARFAVLLLLPWRHICKAMVLPDLLCNYCYHGDTYAKLWCYQICLLCYHSYHRDLFAKLWFCQICCVIIVTMVTHLLSYGVARFAVLLLLP